MVDEKKKRKKWTSILASEEFNFAKIGESLAERPDDLIGRKLVVNLMTFMNDPKKQNISLEFKIVGVKDSSSVCDLIGYRVSKSYTKRVVRKSVDKMEDSFRVQSKDNISYLIKPFMVTRYPCQRSHLTRIQQVIRARVVDYFKTLDSKQVFSQVISNSLQIELRSLARKVFPVAISEIRVLQRL